MNKKLLVLTSLIGTTFVLAVCIGGSPEERAFKAYENTSKIMFEIKNEKEMDSLVNDMKAKYNLIDFTEESKDEAVADIYNSLFYGEEFVKDFSKELKDAKMSFKEQDIRFEKLNIEDFDIVSNPKIYIGDDEYLELKDSFLIYNNEPIVVQNYNKIDKKEEATLEFIMPMIIDNKGNIKAFGCYDEEEREFVDEVFLDKKGIGAFIKDLEDLDSSLKDLSALLDELEPEDNSNKVEEDITIKEEEKETTQKTDKASYIVKSGLNFDIEEGEYATYENTKTGLDIFVTFFEDKSEAIDITMPTSNMENVEYRKQLEIAMRRVGGNSKDINKLTETLKECLTEKYQQKSEVIADIKEYDGMYFVPVIETDDYEVEISVSNAGQYDEKVSVEFWMNN